MHNEHDDTQERAASAQRRAAERAARIRQALDEDTQRAAEAQRERREQTRPLRRGQP